MYDIIGDIHGNAIKLHRLLQKLGYTQNNYFYAHPNRKMIFVGDLIDRGSAIRETLAIVKAMVDNGSAYVVMGNHEYNAICFATKDKDGNHLRPHTPQNKNQHSETLKEFENRTEEWENYLEWFYELPLFLELENLRIVHACWDQKHIEFLRNKLVDNKLTKDLIFETVEKDTPFFWAIEETLKGKEIDMPNGLIFYDKSNHPRKEMRIKWWEEPEQMTYKSWSVLPIESLTDTPIVEVDFSKYSAYAPAEKPVFFGHYWMTGQPRIQKENVCCLDYSAGKGGDLVAYRFDGETVLSDEKLVWV
jgi:hypothetical protein